MGRSRLAVTVAAALAVIVAGSALLYFVREYAFNLFMRVQMDQIDPVSAETRLLVVAPHSDDETLGAAGLIHRTIQRGGRVRVVLMTNGDGFRRAVRTDFHVTYPTPGEYIQLAMERQRETLAAMSDLGLPRDAVTFLGYPDGGLASLWTAHWSAAHPYTSIYTRTSRSPYANSFTREAAFAGESVAGDLETILKQYRPNLVAIPDAADTHPDHWTTNAFVNYALVRSDMIAGEGAPEVLTYLVHHGNWDWPAPVGLHEGSYLVPPWDLWNLDVKWVALPLGEAEEAAKKKAVQEYGTQLAVMKSFLLAFVRTNELFREDGFEPFPRGPLEPTDVPGGRATLPPSNLIVADTPADTLTGDVDGGADIVGIYGGRDDDGVMELGIQTRSPVSRIAWYRLHVRLLRGSGDADRMDLRVWGASAEYESYDSVTDIRPVVEVLRDGTAIRLSFPDVPLESFSALMVEAESYLGGRMVDRTPWQLVMGAR